MYSVHQQDGLACGAGCRVQPCAWDGFHGPSLVFGQGNVDMYR